eukprot:TRINITY_DN3901_c0_g1_i1.p1 TRINITY_DN3901_c0_g1~~TRINITY_DN3901_c0_g1_i1.p1  ORF type:complete len:643 (+),score=216.73 TRINITY_DN3901_c0_g1_i1:476-2404(+)
MSFLTDSSARESLSHTLSDPYDHPSSTGHFGESNSHDYPALGSSDVGHMALSASNQFDNNSNAIPFSLLYNRSETPLPSLGNSFSPSINNHNNNNNSNLSSSFFNGQSPFGSSSSSSPQTIFLPSPTPQLSSTRSPLAVATLPPFQFSSHAPSPGRSFPPQQSGLQQMSPYQLQQMQMLAQMQMQMQMQMMGQQQQQQFNNNHHHQSNQNNNNLNNGNNHHSSTAGQFHPQQMMPQGPNPFGQMGRFTRDSSPIDQSLSKSIYEPPQVSPQPFGQLFRPLNMSQYLLPPGAFLDGSPDQRPSPQRPPSQLYSPPSTFPSQRSPTPFSGPVSLPPFNLYNPFAYPPPYPVYETKKPKLRPVGATEWNEELVTDDETGRKILSKSPKRHRKIRPKVVKGKAIQCQGVNLKRSSQCRNAALMEYVGPRPCYCAEHIEQDPNSLYAKCKSTYHKIRGDGKGCKEIVMKQFVLCHKHFSDHVISFDKEETKQHLDQVNNYLSTLAIEAEDAKKTHLDLYQRKNKLIPKFQRMRAILENRLRVSFPLSAEEGAIDANENVHQADLTDVPSFSLNQSCQTNSPSSSSSPSPSPSSSSSPFSSSSLSSSSSSLLCQISSEQTPTSDQANHQQDLQSDHEARLEAETPAAA